MTSYFEEKGLTEPTSKKNSSNNPDISHFFGDTEVGNSNNVRNRNNMNDDEIIMNDDLEDYLNLLPPLRRDQNGRGYGFFIGADNDMPFNNLIDNLLGPPPASKKFIQNLSPIPKSEINIDEACPICSEKFITANEKSNDMKSIVIRMPCKHLFDKECILSWLKLHNTCPVCRHEVESDDPEWKKKHQIGPDDPEEEEEEEFSIYG
ncbi:hypothetical protein Glove_326g32 [Diversispora epigaea]|uniref:RING-type domain-containing protein n=1 Tax=Diversispora epigaea TaxID=1348612 RepID=A0A397HU09_9GLOM|nr:hypothetical protein Glove_326g32 [Diversispora epigaea]